MHGSFWTGKGGQENGCMNTSSSCYLGHRATCNLLRYPMVRFFETLTQGSRRCPSQSLTNDAIIRIPTSDTQRTFDVPKSQPFPCDFHHHLSQLVDRNHFLRADINRSREIGFHQQPDTLDALINI